MDYNQLDALQKQIRESDRRMVFSVIVKKSLLSLCFELQHLLSSIGHFNVLGKQITSKW
jgi:hypothetical protein